MFLKCTKNANILYLYGVFMKKWRLINSYLRHLLLPGVMVLIIFLATCILGSDQLPQMPPTLPWDKIAHAGMFFLLSAVCYYDYYSLRNGKVSVGRWLFWCFLIPVVYGASIELLQRYVFTTRSAELADFIADVIGSLIATIVAIYYLKYRDKLKKNLSL